MSKILLACSTIRDEVNKSIEVTGFSHPVRWVDSGLHNNTENLRIRLQKELDSISETGEAEEVLLGFGFCGNAIAGLTIKGFSLVIPRVDDCITLVLGSRKRRREISSEAGTYFITRGWLDYERNIWEEYRRTVAKYGKTQANMVFRMMLGSYKRLGVVDTGAYDVEAFIVRAKTMARDLRLKSHLIPGTLTYIEKLLTGPYDDDFLIIKPGETITDQQLINDGSPTLLQ
jgi:hypothetical protein